MENGIRCEWKGPCGKQMGSHNVEDNTNVLLPSRSQTFLNCNILQGLHETTEKQIFLEVQIITYNRIFFFVIPKYICTHSEINYLFLDLLIIWVKI